MANAAWGRTTGHYWAVRPKSMPNTIRIERASTALQAYELAFGRGNPWGNWEAKDLGTRVAVIQSFNKRMALLSSPDGWITLGTPFGMEGRVMATQSPKIHLIPIAAGAKYAICSIKPREAGRLAAVHTRHEFNALPLTERCGRCDAIINGRQQRSHGRR